MYVGCVKEKQINIQSSLSAFTVPNITITIHDYRGDHNNFFLHWLYNPCGGISFNVKRIQRMVSLPANSRQIVHSPLPYSIKFPIFTTISSHPRTHWLVKCTGYARAFKTVNKIILYYQGPLKNVSFLQFSWIDLHNHSNIKKLNIDFWNMNWSLYQACGCSERLLVLSFICGEGRKNERKSHYLFKKKPLCFASPTVHASSSTHRA